MSPPRVALLLLLLAAVALLTVLGGRAALPGGRGGSEREGAGPPAEAGLHPTLRVDRERAAAFDLGPGDREVILHTALERTGDPGVDAPYALAVKAQAADGSILWSGEYWEIGRALIPGEPPAAQDPEGSLPLSPVRLTYVQVDDAILRGARSLLVGVAAPDGATVRLYATREVSSPTETAAAGVRIEALPPAGRSPDGGMLVLQAASSREAAALAGVPLGPGRAAAVNVGGPTHVSIEIEAAPQAAPMARVRVLGLGADRVLFDDRYHLSLPARPIIVFVPAGPATLEVSAPGPAQADPGSGVAQALRGRVRFFVETVRPPTEALVPGSLSDGEWTEVQPDLRILDYHRARTRLGADPTGPVGAGGSAALGTSAGRDRGGLYEPLGGRGPETPVEAEVVPIGREPPRLVIEARGRAPAGAFDLPVEVRLNVEAEDSEGRTVGRYDLLAYAVPSLFDAYPGEPPGGARPTDPVRFLLTLPQDARSVRVSSEEAVDVAFLAPILPSRDVAFVPDDEARVPGVRSEGEEGGAGSGWFPYRPSNDGLLNAIGRTTAVVAMRRLYRQAAPGARPRGAGFEPAPDGSAVRRLVLVPGVPPGLFGRETFHPVTGLGFSVDGSPAGGQGDDGSDARLLLIYRDRRPGGLPCRLAYSVDGRPPVETPLGSAGLVLLGPLRSGGQEVALRIFAADDLPPPPDRFALYLSRPARPIVPEPTAPPPPPGETGSPGPGPVGLPERPDDPPPESTPPSWDTCETLVLTPDVPIALDVLKRGPTAVTAEALCLFDVAPGSLAPPSERCRVSISVEDAAGRPVARRSFDIRPSLSQDCPFDLEGQTLSTPRSLALVIPAMVPPGRYRVRISLDRPAAARARVAVVVSDDARETICRGRPVQLAVPGPGRLRLLLGDDPLARRSGYVDYRVRYRITGPRGAVPLRDAALSMGGAGSGAPFVDIPLGPGSHIVEISHAGDRTVPIRTFLLPDGEATPQEVVVSRRDRPYVRTGAGEPAFFLLPQHSEGRRIAIDVAVPQAPEEPGAAAVVEVSFLDEGCGPLFDPGGDPAEGLPPRAAPVVVTPTGAIATHAPDAPLAGPTSLFSVVPEEGAIAMVRADRAALIACRVGPDAQETVRIAVPAIDLGAAPAVGSSAGAGIGDSPDPRAAVWEEALSTGRTGDDPPPQPTHVLFPTEAYILGPGAGLGGARSDVDPEGVGPFASPGGAAEECLEPFTPGSTPESPSPGALWTRIPGNGETEIIVLPEAGAPDGGLPGGAASAPPVDLRIAYDIPTGGGRAAVRVTRDGALLLPLALPAGKGEFVLPGLEPGRARIGFEVATPGAVFFVSRPPAERGEGPVFGRRRVYPFPPGEPLIYRVSRDGSAPVALSLIVHLAASTDPLLASATLRLSAVDPDDRRAGLAPAPTPRRLAVDFRDTATTDVHPLGEEPPRRVRVYRIPVDVGADLPPGDLRLEATLSGPEDLRAWVRLERVER